MINKLILIVNTVTMLVVIVGMSFAAAELDVVCYKQAERSAICMSAHTMSYPVRIVYGNPNDPV